MGRRKNPEIEKKVLEIFQTHGGILRYADAIKLGIHPRTLYTLKNSGLLEQVQKGLYCLPGLPRHTQPDLVFVAKKVPSGVICLISALFFHKLYRERSQSVKNAKEAPCNLSQAKPAPKQLNLKSLAMQAGLKFSGCPTRADSHFVTVRGITTQIPHFVYLAVRQGYKPPRIDYPPTHFYWFSNSIFNLGIETHELNGVSVRCYSKEKTIVDCFRFRNKIGIDVAIEALKKYWQQGKPHLDLIMKFAKIGRIEKIIKPYIETIINESS